MVVALVVAMVVAVLMLFARCRAVLVSGPLVVWRIDAHSFSVKPTAG
jgi:hypothetical protein